MALEIVPPGQSEIPGPEVTLDDVLEELIEAAERATRHIATYPPKNELFVALSMAKIVLARYRSNKEK